MPMLTNGGRPRQCGRLVAGMTGIFLDVLTLVGSNYTPVAYPSDIFRIQLLDVIGSETP